MVANLSAMVFLSARMALIEMTDEWDICYSASRRIIMRIPTIADSVRGIKGRKGDGTHRVATAQGLDIKERKDLLALEKLEGRDVTYC